MTGSGPLAAAPHETGTDRRLASYFSCNPVNATFTGVHEHDARLADWSPEGLRSHANFLRLSRAPLADQGHTPSGDDIAHRRWAVMDAALLDAFQEIQVAELEGDHFQRGNPSLALGEAAFGAISLMTRPFAPAAERAESLSRRLGAVREFLRGARESLASVPVRHAWFAKALQECTGAHILFARGIAHWLGLHPLEPALARALVEAAASATAAVDEFAEWLRSATPSADASYAVGGEFLSLLVRRGHWCATSLDDLRREAREALAEHQARLSERARAAHPGGWPAIQAELAALHPTVDGYLATFGKTWEACRAKAIEHDLVTWPDFPIRYVPFPEATREAAPYLYYLYYRAPAPYDQLPVIDYVVPPIDTLPDDAARERHLRVWNDSTIKLNHVVHHGALGHHVQNWYAFRAASQVGRIAATDCASRIGMFCGGTMAEGWACYATDLMDEVGFLTPYESVAEEHTRVRMAARMVVDLELHTGRLSFDDAVRFYQEQVGMPPETAKAEVTKNSMFPGTAMMYRLGTEAIHALRRDVARLRGPAFSLRAFHDELLSFGSIPVLLAREIMLAAPVEGRR